MELCIFTGFLKKMDFYLILCNPGNAAKIHFLSSYGILLAIGKAVIILKQIVHFTNKM